MNNLWNPFSAPYELNPYPTLERIREQGPAYRSQSGDIIVTGYEEVKTILLNPGIFRVGNRFEWIERQVRYLENKNEDLTAILEAMNTFLVQLNAPEHTVLRSLVMEAWDNHEVSEIITKNSEALLNQVDSHFDLVKEYAVPLPALTMAHILGIATSDYRKLKDYASDLVLSLDMYTSFKTLVQINKAAKEMINYFSQFIDSKIKQPENDLTSKIILKARDKNFNLTKKQLVSICIFLFMAGEETTVNLIGTGALNLIKHPIELNEIKNNKEYWDKALDESLRIESPVHLVGRIANGEFELQGFPIKKDETLTLCLGAANRDPKIFHDPDSFLTERKFRHHLAFGAGIHFCLGSWLAKVQWKIAMQTLFNQFPDITLAGQPVWSKMLSIRGLTSMPVKA